MNKIFISGSIRIKNIDKKVEKRIDNIINSNFPILLGDANGVDTSVQKFIKSKAYKNVIIYCSGEHVRNNIGRWKVKKIHTGHYKKTRLFYTAKDIQMAKECDYGLMVWDTTSTGTLNNVYELLRQGKKSLVFLNNMKEFILVSNVDEFQKLLSFMEKSSFEKADKKVQLKQKIQGLKCIHKNITVSNQTFQRDQLFNDNVYQQTKLKSMP
ncbi:MAG: hypothetical protein OMM_02945 [Candidatus Magnetoglobus multicellularis str. Araruama]|uniref:Uncharacterized protein n=1 Tax=Candidatus Magnetoglobus multicellularis str. Araruama TaxID=890399 RepID=A0A1V1P7R5_9BACT|nr:MAG: hypothetical protein OMM_02945 [Candidatus Magnetoglobus multicellularis str. Araruama]